MIMVECRRKVGLAGGSGLVVTMVADFEQTGRQLQENLSFYSESTTANVTFQSIRTREYTRRFNVFNGSFSKSHRYGVNKCSQFN